MIVFDASTLILLAKVELLTRVVNETQVIITDIVESESTERRELPDAKFIRKLIDDGLIKVEVCKSVGDEQKIRTDFNMGTGEVSSLILAKQKGLPLATDDKQAIRVSKMLGIPFLTAIHFLISLHQKGRLTTEIATVKLNHLEKLGRYNPSIIRNTLHIIKGKEE